jgi:hypothetical protein
MMLAASDPNLQQAISSSNKKKQQLQFRRLT